MFPASLPLHVCVLSHFIHVRLFETVGCHAPGDLPDPGIKPASLMSPALAGRFFTTSATWGAQLLLLFLRVLTAPPSSGKGQPWRTSPVIQVGGGRRGLRTPEVVGSLGGVEPAGASAFIPLRCTPSPAQRSQQFSVLYWTLTHTGAPGKTHRGTTFTY